MKKIKNSVLVRPAEFARIVHVVRSTVTRAVQNGDLVADSAGSIDINHPANAVFILNHVENFDTVEPTEEFAPFDADSSNLWIFIKVKNTYTPVMAIEFASGKDASIREVHFPHDEIVTLVKNEGAITGVEIGIGEKKKRFKPYYATFKKE